jgi:hypothetical protein
MFSMFHHTIVIVTMEINNVKGIVTYHSSDIRSIRFKHTCIIRFFGLFKKIVENI